MLRALLLALALGGSTAEAQVPVPAPMTVAPADSLFVPGTYHGLWPDGRALHETLRIVSGDLITMQRHDYSAQPVPFHRIAPGVFRNAHGSTLTVITSTRLQWANASGGTIVTYDLLP